MDKERMKNEEQMDWLRMVRDHVANSVHVARIKAETKRKTT
jgi:hypothetical protein